MRYRNLAIALLSAASAPALLGASEAGAATATAAKATGLQEVVVTARRRAERLQDVPAVVTALTPDKLKNAQVATARQLVGLVPSLNINSGNQRDFQRFAIRGQGATVGGSESVTAYFAEAPMSQFVSGGPGLYYDLENLQVLNGPQGTLFGRNTIGGAVLFYPHRPVNRLEAQIQTGYGDYNNRELAAMVNFAPVPGIAALRFDFDMRRRDGFTRVLSNGTRTDNINYKSYRGSLLLTPTPWLENYTVAQYTSSNTGGTGVIVEAINPAAPAALLPIFNAALALQQPLGNRITQGTGLNWWTTNTLFAVNTTTIKPTPNLTIKNIASLSDVGASGGFDNDGTPVPLTQWFRDQYSGNPSGPGESRNEYITEEFQVQGRYLDNKLNWVVGGFYQNSYPYQFQHTLLQAFGFPFGTTNTTDSFLAGTSKAVFAQFTFDFGAVSQALNNLKLTGGYRYTWDTRHYTVASYNTFTMNCINVVGKLPNCTEVLNGKWKAPTYNLTLDYKLTPKIMVYATTRSGYKSGGFNVVANILVPKSYDPEHVTDYEVGTKADFSVMDRPARVDFDVFGDHYSSIQRSVFQPDPNTGSILTFLSSAAAARIRGVEAAITFKPIDPLTIDVTYSYLNARYKNYPGFRDFSLPGTPAQQITNLKGRPLPFAPRNKVGVDVRYDLPIDPDLGNINFTSNVSYQSHYLDTDQIQPVVWRIGGYTLVNFGVNWENIKQSHFDLELYVTNAFDENSIAAGQVFYYSAFAAAASWLEPRMVGFRVRYNFGT
jgi:iron complex outermembrane receptor protein